MIESMFLIFIFCILIYFSYKVVLFFTFRGLYADQSSTDRISKSSSAYKKLKKNIFLTLVFCVLIYFAARWLHAYQRDEDRSLEVNIVSSLINKNYYIPGKELQNADIICFLPSYLSPESLKTPLSQQAKVELNLKINSYIDTGIGESVWWIIVLEKRNIKKLFRMSSSLRPKMRKSQCLDTNNFILNFSKLDRYTLYFEIQTKE